MRTRKIRVITSAVAGAIVTAFVLSGNAATITVDSSADNTTVDGAVTLREALLSCNVNANYNADVVAVGAYTNGGGAGGCDVILIDSSLDGGTVNLDVHDPAFRTLTVTDDLRITGNGANRLTVDSESNQDDRFRHITVSQSGTTLTVEGLRLYDGANNGRGASYDTVEPLYGGAVYATNDTTLIFRDCVFEQNHLNNLGTARGGAVFTRGDLTIENCAFENQKIYNFDAKNGGLGLNLCVEGTVSDQLSVTLTNVTMFGNRVVGNADVRAGAVLYGSYCDVVMTDCVFTNFTITDANGFGEDAHGGLINLNNGDLTLDNCLLADSVSVVIRNNGGAIYHQNGALSILNSTVRDCTAGADRQGKGGGIYHTGGDMVVSNSTISGNYSQSGNNRYPHGGGIYCGANSDLLVVDSCISDNESHNTSGGTGDRNNLGGGVYYAPGAGYTGRFDNVTFSGNMVTGPFDPAVAKDDGGGALAVASGTAILRNCTIVRNCAFHAGGGIHRDGGTVSLYNCIVAGNASSDPVRNDLSGTFNEVRNCIIGDQTDVTITTSANNIMGPDLSGNPKVGVNLTTYYSDAVTDVALEDYAASRADLDNVLSALKMEADPSTPQGGDTTYHALKSGSVAIDAGDNSYADGTSGGAALTFDQRGFEFLRINDDTVDIGSFETGSSDPNAPAGTVILVY